MKIYRIYDNGGRSFDRYTVYLAGRDAVRDLGQRMCLGMSGNPTSPQGFCQHSEGIVGRHNGRKIGLADLPIECQRVLEDYGYHI
jgi:hypothetical protein